MRALVRPMVLAGLAVTLLATAGTAVAQQKWGALAISAEGYGWAKGYVSKSEAENFALTNCRKHTKRDTCKVRPVPAGACAAVASWSRVSGSTRHYGNVGSFGDTLSSASNKAMASCRAKHGNCRIEHSFCNT